MRRALLTLSGLQQAATCPGSAVLPRFGNVSVKADMGSAAHEYNAVLGEEGRLAADEQADDIADRWGLTGKERAIFFARARALDLQIPEGAIYELPLCLRADGSIEPVQGGRGEYLVPDDALVAGTLDILFATPEPLLDERWCPAESVLWTPDLKTGSDAHVAPIARNWQARVSALLGARWTGAEAVVPAIVYPSAGGGSWDVHMEHGRPAPLRAEGLAQVEREVRELHATVLEQAERVAAGNLPRLVTGAHCTYCAARPGCPAHVTEARALATGELRLAPGPLTDEQARRGAGILGPVKATTKTLEEALRVHVGEHGPIALPDGRVYEPQAGEELVFFTRATYEALRAEVDPLVGPDEGARLVDAAFSTTKDAVYGVIRAAHEKAGLKRRMKVAFERVASRQIRADAEATEAVVVSGAGAELLVERAGNVETLPTPVVERRWPVVVERVSEMRPTERWSVHYPKGGHE